MQVLSASSRNRISVAKGAFALVLFVAGSIQLAQAKTIKFDPPGSTSTMPAAINDAGSITGFYLHSEGAIRSFLRAPDGTIATIDVGDTICGTYAYSINKDGVVVGTGAYKMDNLCNAHAFVRAADGSISTFDVPGAVSTGAGGINNKGVITGAYLDDDRISHGFVRARNGTFAIFDPVGSVSTSPVSINKKGVIAGSYLDSSQVRHGFVRAKDGTITPFDPPDSTLTYPTSINDSGEIAGTYRTVQSTTYGFIRSSDGSITTIDPEASSDVVLRSINNDGMAVGFYIDPQDKSDGFSRNANGNIKKFYPKDSLGVWDIGGINSKGVIAGSQLDVNEVNVHGFVRGQ